MQVPHDVVGGGKVEGTIAVTRQKENVRLVSQPRFVLPTLALPCALQLGLFIVTIMGMASLCVALHKCGVYNSRGV